MVDLLSLSPDLRDQDSSYFKPRFWVKYNRLRKVHGYKCKNPNKMLGNKTQLCIEEIIYHI